MPANYVLLGEVTLGASAASVTFSNIPQSGYTDLKVAISARGDYAALGSSYKLSFNGSSSNFSIRALEGAGSGTPSSFTGTQYIGSAVGATATASTFNNAEIYIPNYLSTTAAKSFSVDAVSENNGTEAYADLIAGLWNPGTQAAIYSVGLTPTSGNFLANSTFYLYGLAAVGTTPVIAPFATGGDVIQNDGTYWIHTFLSSGTFTPQKPLTCGYLVVAGGGGGGGVAGDASSGGGAGGLRSSVSPTGGGGSAESALSVTNQAYTITVGAGGTGGVGNAAGTAGTNSIFSTVTSTGGGFGSYSGNTGGNGGSGGGASGTGTANQGYGAGTGVSGGGGAGGAGTTTAYNGTNKGGVGVNNSITGTSVGYAGGGNPGGGRGNTAYGGGEGDYGLNANNATSGTVNTGGGGGGRWSDPTSRTGGAGGSGIVIVRYPIA
jgi:hypothetical protein